MANPSRREQCKTIADLPYIKCTWNLEYEEFRVTIDGLTPKRQEDVAYYTGDFEDALGTAEKMSKFRAKEIQAMKEGTR